MRNILNFQDDKATSPRIRYAQCWEDPDVLNQALEAGPEDDVVSIGSAGDNAFSLLLQNPKSITAVDSNPAQIYLIRLKQAAMQLLEYEEFIRFLGVHPCSDRLKLYNVLRPALDDHALCFWDHHSRALSGGVIHYGKFEQYFSRFRKFILPLIHPHGRIDKCLAAKSLPEQETFFNEKWNTCSWRALFRIFFSKMILGNLGRDPACFKYVEIKNIADELMMRAQHGLTEIPVKGNYFLFYILTGSYPDLNILPPYLRERNFKILKQNVHRMQLINLPLEKYLQNLKPGSVSKFNLSDIFEYMPDGQVEDNLELILQVSRDKARIVFWTLFVPGRIPSVFTHRLKAATTMAQDLQKHARTFFYGSLNILNIEKNE
jgi:S-adenosylmethionine-diacylglycerol 3-amino-3-carboxypropyl transferase